MKREFYKMQGLGNDYIYFDCMREELASPGETAIRLSDRHFGIGGDGIVLILPSRNADCTMRMFNADGSEGKMCGNAIRCVGKFLYEIGGVRKERLFVETLSGIKLLTLSVEKEHVVSVTVDMGRAEFLPSRIPVIFDGEEMMLREHKYRGEIYQMSAVSMGNPHNVIFREEIDGLDLACIGPHFETLPLFPERVNTEFVQAIDEKTLKMRVWERGSGETLACGTGACAAVAVAVKLGKCGFGEQITVLLKGGELHIEVDGEYAVRMTGGCAFTFRGEVDL